MHLPKKRATTVALLVGAMLLSNGQVMATPLSSAVAGSVLTSQAAGTSALTEVRVRRSRGGGVAAGIIAGAIIGGIIASQARPNYYESYPPYRVYRPYPYNAAVAYCMQRFRSYDPYTGTYLGYDGFRHPCP